MRRGAETETIDDPNFDNLSNIELENEQEIEEALAKLSSRLEALRGNDKLMRIGNNQYDLNDKDPIYFIMGPNKKRTKTNACISCRDYVFKSET